MKGDRKHPDSLLIIFFKVARGPPFQVQAGKQIPKPHHDLLSQKFLRWFFFIEKPENHYSISISSSGSKELKTIEGTRPRLNVWIYGIVMMPYRSDGGSRT